MSTSKRGSYTSEDPSSLSLSFPRRDGMMEALYATALTPKESGDEDSWIYRYAPKDYWIDWYELDLKKGVISRSLPTMPPSAREDSTAAVVSSNKMIFVVGGACFYRSKCPKGMSDTHEHDYVFFFDYDRPDKGWREGPPMLAERRQPSVVALDTKVYVFGGKSHDNSGPHAELFDVDENQWRPLPPPPPLLLSPDSDSDSHYDISGPLLLDSPRRRILVHFENNNYNNHNHNNINSSLLYAYNVDDNSWHCLKDSFDDRFRCRSGWWSSGRVVIVGEVIYWLAEIHFERLSFCQDQSKCCLRAYDLAENKHLNVNWLPSFRVRITVRANLYHLGGRDLCLADHNHEGFEYIKIRVFREKDSGEVYAHAKSDSLTSIPFEIGKRNGIQARLSSL